MFHHTSQKTSRRKVLGAKSLGQRLGSCNVSSRSPLRRSRAHPWYDNC